MNELIGKNISLKLIAPDHREKLRLHAQDDRIWQYNTHIARYSDDLFNTWFTLAYNNSLTNQEQCFSICYNDQFIGSSRYYTIKNEAKEISVGFTWIHPTYWGTCVNPELKYLLLKNAFDQGYEKVFFHVDNLNLHSQAAMKKLGAEVVSWNKSTRMRLDGSIRTTVEYVVTHDMWPKISENLKIRIS